MLRALVVALLLANGLFFAWTRGWLAPLWPAPSHGDREPGRLAAQVRPELMVLMSPGAASSALAAASAASAAALQACLEAGPFNDAQVADAEAALAQAELPPGSWQRAVAQPAASYGVYFGRFADVDALRTKVEELRRLRLAPEALREPAELVPGLVLSRSDTREAAEAALAQLNQRGVRTARVVALPPPPRPQQWLRAASAGPELQAQLLALKLPDLGAGFVPCAKAP